MGTLFGCAWAGASAKAATAAQSATHPFMDGITPETCIRES
jgi:hypothetical protein